MKIDAPMSWEKPIEEQLLIYVRHMATHMEMVANKPVDSYFFGLFKDDDLQKGARHYANAYRTVEKEILRIIRMKI